MARTRPRHLADEISRDIADASIGKIRDAYPDEWRAMKSTLKLTIRNSILNGVDFHLKQLAKRNPELYELYPVASKTEA